MIKKTLLVLLFILLCPTVAFAAPTVQLDGQLLAFDVEPTIENGRTLVPLRAIFEAMGATVNWDTETQTATAVKDDTTVMLIIGDTSPTVNGSVISLDVPAKIVDGRTLAPLRFVGEAFGGTVEWNEETQTASIASKEPLPIVEPEPKTEPENDLQSISISFGKFLFNDEKLSISYPEGWIGTEDEKSFVLHPQQEDISSQIIGVYTPLTPELKNTTLGDVLKIHAETPLVKEWTEISRSKINIAIGECWLIRGNFVRNGISSEGYILLGLDSETMYNIVVWWEKDKWDEQKMETSMSKIISSISKVNSVKEDPSSLPAGTIPKTPPGDLAKALKQYFSINGFNNYTISTGVLSNSIFVTVEVEKSSDWEKIPSSSRKKYLSDMLNQLIAWYPSVQIVSIGVEITYTYSTWNPKLNDNITTFDVKDGWRVSNSYTLGSAKYIEFTGTKEVDPDR